MRDPGNKVAVRAGGCYNVDHRNTGFCTNRPKMMVSFSCDLRYQVLRLLVRQRYDGNTVYIDQAVDMSLVPRAW